MRVGGSEDKDSMRNFRGGGCEDENGVRIGGSEDRVRRISGEGAALGYVLGEGI